MALGQSGGVPADGVEMRTERLLLRRWTDIDREPFAEMNADPVVMQYLPAPLSRAESDAFFDRIQAGFDARGWGLWAVETLARGGLIGFVGLSRAEFDAHFTPAVEIGWRLTSAAWGRGFATEAAREAMAYGFNQLKLDEIVSFTAAINVPSEAVMKRLGMHHDPADDFDHPVLQPGSPLRKHVLYRLRSSRGALSTPPSTPASGQRSS